MNKGLNSIHLNKIFSTFIILLAGCILLSTSTYAAKCVRPNGNGGCYDNIQDAIDAVAEGGTVKVYPGIYYETFDANKEGITILGMGEKNTDVRINSLISENINTITRDRVLIKNLTIEGARSGIQVTIPDINTFTQILNVNVFKSRDFGISLSANRGHLLVRNCRISGCGQTGVYILDGYSYVKRTTITDCGEHGIYSNYGVAVWDCTIKNSGQCLIYSSDHITTIYRSKLYSAGTYGIHLESTKVARLKNNLVKGTGSTGIYINGELSNAFRFPLTVKRNTVMHAQDIGIHISCFGGESKVVNNESSYNGSNGFLLDSPSPVLFKKNKAINNFNGFSFYGSGEKMITENESRYNIGHGFYVEDGTLENNIASENGAFGYYLNGTTATQNKAINNMETGFHVESLGNLLRNNRAIGNLTYGIHVTGDFNDMINNTMLDSLYDKCDEGTGNTWTNNTYDTECP